LLEGRGKTRGKKGVDDEKSEYLFIVGTCGGFLES